MLFESLSDKLQDIFKRLRGKGRLTEADVDAVLREIRLVLLEADVNFRVAKEFISRVRQRAVGEEVFNSLTPAQQVISIVRDELVALLGGSPARMEWASQGFTLVFMVGLQGSGKTTTSAKLARLWKSQGKRPLLVGADVRRPAAIEQLGILAGQVGVPFFETGIGRPALEVCRGAVAHAEKTDRDVVLIDTAGRLHVDQELMDELIILRKALSPQHVILVVDSLTGQDAVNSARAFNEALNLTGLILTKLDADARGGAALSVTAETGCRVLYAGVGEKTADLEPFFPDRIASRILGMGDVLTLIDRVKSAVDEDKAREMEARLRRQDFNLEDFLEQISQVQKMGPLDQLVSMIPGVPKLKGLQVDEGELMRMQAIVRSMTRDERLRPEIINGSRRKRIAAGSGNTVANVNRLLNQFEQGKKLVKQLGKLGGKGRGGRFPFPLG